MHPTIQRLTEVVHTGDETAIRSMLSESVTFLPPTYHSAWHGAEAVAALLGHVGQVFSNFEYRRIMGDGVDWALEFQCNVGALEAVGADLITLDAHGLVERFEVVMRPHKAVGALREAMTQRVGSDARFLQFREALSKR